MVAAACSPVCRPAVVVGSRHDDLWESRESCMVTESTLIGRPAHEIDTPALLVDLAR
jgi:hypothetical protein